MSHILAKAALVALACAVPGAASAQGPIEGAWRNSKGSVVVKIDPCENGWCGTVVDATEKAKAVARRGGTPNLIGTRILSGVRAEGNGIYRGRAFDPKRNVRAPATIRILGPSTLLVKGCLIGGLLCKEQRWTRIS